MNLRIRKYLRIQMLKLSVIYCIPFFREETYFKTVIIKQQTLPYIGLAAMSQDI